MLEESRENPNPSESSSRKTYKKIAEQLLEGLDYTTHAQRLMDHFRGKKKFIGRLQQKVPFLENDKDYIDYIVKCMDRIPNPNHARALLATALFGEPAQADKNGKVIVASFNVAQPSLRKVQTSFSSIGGRNNPLWITDTRGTDLLVGRLVSGTGFAETHEISSLLKQVKRSHEGFLTHPGNSALVLKIKAPTDLRENSKVRTSYNYHLEISQSSK